MLSKTDLAFVKEVLDGLEEIREYLNDRADINERGGPNAAMQALRYLDAAIDLYRTILAEHAILTESES